MNMTNDEYNEYIKKRQPKSPLGKDMLLAFLIGGAICCVGQGITDIFSHFGMGKTDAGTAASITMVFIGALLTGLGFYDNLGKFGGGGSLVPITGFANSVVSPALEFKAEGIVTGMAAKIFTIAGPVIVFGISASVIYGLVLLLFGLA
ncbi:MAG: stage V sporulation protein AC [Butyricicoccus sp.]|nr:stage V sporulation protein AC [Butyricicoccus sp.]